MHLHVVKYLGFYCIVFILLPCNNVCFDAAAQMRCVVQRETAITVGSSGPHNTEEVAAALANTLTAKGYYIRHCFIF